MAKFVPRLRKRKALAREKESAREAHENAPSNSKKAKRLDKYLVAKQKKEERRELLEKLAKSTLESDLFMSTKFLGKAKETKKDRKSRALREAAAGIESDEEPPSPEALTFPSNVVPHVAPHDAGDDHVIGAGLKRPLELDSNGRPRLPTKRAKHGHVVAFPGIGGTDEEWNGFSSSESNSESNSEDRDDDEEGAGSGTSVDSSDDGSGYDSQDSENGAKPRRSAFGQWAHTMVNRAAGYEPSGVDGGDGRGVLQIPQPANFTPRPLEQDPLPAELEPASSKAAGRQVFSVPVTRTEEMQKARMELPILAHEHRIMEAVHSHDVVVICGATGSGKTTQVPQFLFEAGYGTKDSPTPGLVGVTQPRRVAAVSMSKRVGQELGEKASQVAYQIRFNGTVDSDTAVKFMTDGVLLRELSEDVCLSKYSVIIIDEAHERSINTDILIGFLSKIVPLRRSDSKKNPAIKPLKVVFMSATLDVSFVTSLFKETIPVVEIEGRQFPVSMHFSRATNPDYVSEAFQKVSRGHRKLPPGSFLVFLTGRDEIFQLSKRLREEFGSSGHFPSDNVRLSATDAAFEAEEISFGAPTRLHALDDDYIESDEDAGDEDRGEDDEGFNVAAEGEVQTPGPSKMHILPLYSLLPVKEQMAVFAPPPPGSRLVVLATNLAETSLTIPGVRYVFDCGRSKERRYQQGKGSRGLESQVQSFQVGWISKASAAQRSGRAGRTGPGHCYRLYSSAIFESEFPDFTEPEILRTPVDGVVLQLRGIGLVRRSADIIKFPFPSPPDRKRLAAADKILTYLRAVDASTGRTTEMGESMAIFPVAPRFAHILVRGASVRCLHYTVALVAALSSPALFLSLSEVLQPAQRQNGRRRYGRDEGRDEEWDGEDETEQLRGKQGTIHRAHDDMGEEHSRQLQSKYSVVQRQFASLDDRSDAIKLLKVVGEYAHEPTRQWCESHFVRYKVLREIQLQRKQLVDLIRTKGDATTYGKLQFIDRLDRPDEKRVAYMRQVIACGFIDQIAIRADKHPDPPALQSTPKPTSAVHVPYLPLFPIQRDEASDNPAVYVHPSSVLARLSTQEMPTYVVYSHLQNPHDRRGRTWMHPLTHLSVAELLDVARGTSLVEYGKPIKEAKSQTGKSSMTEREVWAIPYLKAPGTGTEGWPLGPPRRVKQKNVVGRGWIAVDE